MGLEKGVSKVFRGIKDIVSKIEQGQAGKSKLICFNWSNSSLTREVLQSSGSVSEIFGKLVAIRVKRNYPGLSSSV